MGLDGNGPLSGIHTGKERIGLDGTGMEGRGPEGRGKAHLLGVHTGREGKG
jgi:hypothetical protein